MTLYEIQELALARAIEAVAVGETKSSTDAYIAEAYPQLDAATRAVVLRDAYVEATNYGVEREDIDPSWRR